MSVLSFFGVKPERSEPPVPAPAVVLAPVPADPDAGVSRETGLVLDALSSILQHYGKQAYDTDQRTADEIRGAVHGWMLHASMGAPRPGREDDRPTAGVFYRDWKGLTQFFAEQRRDESRYVVHALDDLRSVVWAFIGAAHQVVVEEQTESRIATDHLHRMRTAVEGNATDVIKREALAVVAVMEQLLTHRRKRQSEQYALLANKLRKISRELEDARRESAQDPLTGLANRKAFDEYITRSIELHSLLGQPACVMMIDVDHFKLVNDTLGHPVGDAVLRQIADLLSRTFLRRVDFVCRYGGDEFAVILQETSLENALPLAERLRQKVHDIPVVGLPAGGRATNPDEGTQAAPRLSFSIGVAQLTIGDDAVSWIQRADVALYNAKHAGRDTIASAVA